MTRHCSFCDGPCPDASRMVRRPYGVVCYSCARYIDARGEPMASMMPRGLRRAIVYHFEWGRLRDDMANMVYADMGGDPFEGLR